MTPLERAARALAQTRYGYDAWKQEDADGRQRLLAEARAVIEAIREPSEAVRKAMRQTVPITGHDWEYNDPVVSDGVMIDDEPGDCWRAMIDALLEEGR